MDVTILALPGVFGSAIFGCIDVLETANLLGAVDFSVQVRTPTRSVLRTGFGYPIAARVGLPRRQQHVIVVPGFGVGMPEQALRHIDETVRAHPRVLRWLGDQVSGGAVVAASCAGTFVVAAAGLLDGHGATTTWWLAEGFRARHPDVQLEPSTILVRSGAVVTAGAAMSVLDLSLHLVERFGTSKLAARCAKVLVLEKGRRSQAAYAIAEFARSQDEVVRRAVELLETELHTAPSVDQVARRCGVTTRTLNRRFREAMGSTPSEYRTRLRIDRARRLLEQPEHSVEQVAHAVGYADSSVLYRAFTRAVGLSPREYQQRFRPS